MPCKRRSIPKNRGGARSDRADSGRHPGENALLSSQRGRAGSVLDMIVTAPLGRIIIEAVGVAREDAEDRNGRVLSVMTTPMGIAEEIRH